MVEPLSQYAHELRRIYGLQCEVDAALAQWLSFLSSPARKPDARIFFGKGNPNSADASFQYWDTVGALTKKAGRDGENSRRLRRMAIVFAYTYWDVETRAALASICSREKNDIRHPAFADLNKLRQAIVHVNGRVDKDMEVMSFICRGDNVDLSNAQFSELFKVLTLSLNDIAKEYLGVTTDYRFDHKFSS